MEKEYIASIASIANPFKGKADESHIGVILEVTEKGSKIIHKTREHFDTEDAARNAAQKRIDRLYK